ncbi:hypothetical protein LO762_14630 [Actinocorallia sp. API 0066]|uniref:hypothetical protein n=1 Tax=Actinocorallia sp. API 0066 TaxID=2896846 RepID=UPI001E37BE0D|nr:hypothetical protein [Actinocorallia sp. API 0066]MCD0450417.1 hypothetical protein [Actinocorallia sp. API 0066]
MDLAELGSLLLKGGCADEVKDAVWREMVTRARTGRPEWVIGCVGLALPGLRNVVARASHKCAPGLAEDIVSEAVAEFVAQLQQIDLGRPHVVARLLLWARKGALRARGRETRHVMRREALDVLDEVAASGEGAIGQEPVPRRFGSGRSRRGRRS